MAREQFLTSRAVLRARLELGSRRSERPTATNKAVCFVLAIEVLHKHRAGDDQRYDQLARARGEVRRDHSGTPSQGL